MLFQEILFHLYLAVDNALPLQCIKSNWNDMNKSVTLYKRESWNGILISRIATDNHFYGFDQCILLSLSRRCNDSSQRMTRSIGNIFFLFGPTTSSDSCFHIWLNDIPMHLLHTSGSGIYIYIYDNRVNCRFAPNQWETALHCNDVSQWLGAREMSSISWLSESLSKFYKRNV